MAAPCLLAATSNVQTFCLHSQLEKSICYEFSPMSNLCLKITQIKCKTKNDGRLEAYYWMQTFTVSHCKGKKKNENQTNHRVTWENTGHCDSGLKFWKVIYGIHRKVWVCNNINVSRQCNKIEGINFTVTSCSARRKNNLNYLEFELRYNLRWTTAHYLRKQNAVIGLEI